MGYIFPVMSRAFKGGTALQIMEQMVLDAMAGEMGIAPASEHGLGFTIREP